MIVGLCVGGLVVLLLFGAAVVFLVRNADISLTSGTTTTRRTFSGRTTTSRVPSTSTGPTTSVAGTGPTASITTSQAVRFLREQQQAATPDLRVGVVTCPRDPYNVGHVFVCRMRLEDASVLYRVEVTGPDTLKMDPTKPIVDTKKAEALVEAAEPGTTADCGSQQVRQLDVGARVTCRTATSTWDFTVTPEGDLDGKPR